MKYYNLNTIFKALSILIIFIGFTFFVYYLTHDFLNIEQIREWVNEAGWFAPLIIILLKASTLVFVPLMGGPIYLLAGTLFGFWGGIGYTLIGDILGSAIAFLIARYLGKTVILKLLGEKAINQIDSLYCLIGEWKGLLTARIFGFIDIVNYAAGFTPISLKVYLIVTLISQIPQNVFMVSLIQLPDMSYRIRIYYGLFVLIYLISIGIFWNFCSSHLRKAKLLNY